MKQIALIYNPTSKKCHPKHLKRVRGFFEKKGYKVTLISTKLTPTGVTLSLPDMPPTFYLVAGGDGTLNIFLNALQTRQTAIAPLAILPYGTANVLARELSVHSLSLNQLLDKVEAASIQYIDVGLANEKMFCLGLGSGLDSISVDQVNPLLKKWIGKQAYALKALQLLHKVPSFRQLEVQANGRTYQGNWCVIANTTHYGGPYKLTQNGSVSDGKFDVFVLNVQSISQALSVILQFHLGRIPKLPFATYFQADTLTLAAQEPIQIDGDIFPHSPKIHLKLLPRYLPVVS